MEVDRKLLNGELQLQNLIFPKDNTEFFKDTPYNWIDWLRQYSTEQSEIYIRGFWEECCSWRWSIKPRSKLLGEKVRMMLSYMMLKKF